MLMLILFLVVGAVLAYLSQHNLTPVTVNVGPYIFSGIPLFYVIIGSVITGLVVAYVFYLTHLISTTLKLRGKKQEIKKNKDQVLELTKRVHQLELENEKLKHQPKSSLEPVDRHAL